MKALLITACGCCKEIAIERRQPKIYVPLMRKPGQFWSADLSPGPLEFEMDTRTFKFYCMHGPEVAEYREEIEPPRHEVPMVAMANKRFIEA
jgi:hypothetical protein